MTDHTRIEKIGGNSICFSSHPSRAKNRYDSLATPLGFKESDQYLAICCLPLYFACLILSVMIFFVVIMHIFFDLFMSSFICIRIMLVLFYVSDYEQGW